MMLVAKTRLDLSASVRSDLLALLREANRACNFISEKASGLEKGFSKRDLHDASYHPAREEFEALSAQMVVRAIGKVADAYKTNPGKENRFDLEGGFPLDYQIVRFEPRRGKVNIQVGAGRREEAPYLAGKRSEAMIDAHLSGHDHLAEADLIYRKDASGDGRFYLYVGCEVEEEEELPPEDVQEVIGVDLGITNLAVTSTGKKFSGAQIDLTRERYERQRQDLQAKQTRSATAKLKKTSGRQRRFQKDVNHCISKRIVEEAKARNAAIALEDLEGITKGIAARTTVSRPQRSRFSNWSHYDLRQKITYKARRAGVPVLKADPAYTSQMCSECGEKGRRRGERFECPHCGYSGHADHNASKNVAREAITTNAVRQNIVRTGVVKSDSARKPKVEGANSQEPLRVNLPNAEIASGPLRRAAFR